MNQQTANPTLGNDGKFSVMEIFRTVQGEGRDVGRETIFLRLAVCNLRCTWCDTKDSWTQAGAKEQLTIDGIIERFHRLDPAHEVTHFVITGGEPMLHNHDLLARLMEKLAVEGWRYGTIETNGTIPPNEYLSYTTWLFSVSPKLQSSGNRAYTPELLERWVETPVIKKTQLKFVIANTEDMEEVSHLLKTIRPEARKRFALIFQPEESANNYTLLPRMVSESFIGMDLHKMEFDIRYIPQVHKMTGWR